MLESWKIVQEQAPWALQGIFFLLGACVGSFLNVCIYRIPQRKSVIFPGSHCACGKPIAPYDNIPILSWILLRGRARCCGARFSIRYPLIEFATGLLFWGAWMLLPSPLAFPAMVFGSILITASFIDLDHMIIPDRFTMGGMALGIIWSVWVPEIHGFTSAQPGLDKMRALVTSLEGAFISSALLLWVGVVAAKALNRDAMGMGDIKLMGAIGAFCGWQGGLFAIFGGAFAGTLLYLPVAIWQRLKGREEVASETSESIETEESTESEESMKTAEKPSELLKDVEAEAEVAPPTERAPFAEEEDAPQPGEIPFGPALALGAILYMLFFRETVADYFSPLANLLFP